jgi:SAM-dependent methyltransferase
MPHDSEFDTYASNYDEALTRGISVSGEDKDFFAHGRIAWLADRLRQLGEKPGTVLDFGCGTGSSTPFLLDILKADRCIGIDTSGKSIEVARELHGSERADFEVVQDFDSEGTIDLAFCNGVFHHIPPSERPAAFASVHRALRSGGLFAFWENNPWNPGTRIVMSRIPFDRDAITIPMPEARRALGEAWFEAVHIDFLFVFPNFLRCFRWLEPMLSRVPIGAQYMVLARKRDRT